MGLRLTCGLQEGSGPDLMEESSSCEDHGELTRVVGVVEPGLMVDVPRVVPPRETHDAIPGLTPHPERHQSAVKQPYLLLQVPE